MLKLLHFSIISKPLLEIAASFGPKNAFVFLSLSIKQKQRSTKGTTTLLTSFCFFPTHFEFPLLPPPCPGSLRMLYALGYIKETTFSLKVLMILVLLGSFCNQLYKFIPANPWMFAAMNSIPCSTRTHSKNNFNYNCGIS